MYKRNDMQSKAELTSGATTQSKVCLFWKLVGPEPAQNTQRTKRWAKHRHVARVVALCVRRSIQYCITLLQQQATALLCPTQVPHL